MYIYICIFLVELKHDMTVNTLSSLYNYSF